MMWGVGGIAGPPLAGTAMDAMGGTGLPLFLGAVFLVLGLVTLRYPLTDRPTPAHDSGSNRG